MKAWIAAAIGILAILGWGCGISGSGDPSTKTDDELRIEDIEITSLTDTTATLSWKTTLQTASTLFYGAESSLLAFTKGSPLGTRHTVQLRSLSENTEYFYQILATDGFGNNASTDTESFRTDLSPDRNDDTPPVIRNVRVTGITMVGATIAWETDDRTVGLVRSTGTTGSTFETRSTPADDFKRSHAVTVSGLYPSTTYEFAIDATNLADLSSTKSGDPFDTMAEPSLYIHPSNMQYSIGEDIEFEIRIENSVNLAGISVTVIYPDDALQVRQIIPGQFFSRGGHFFGIPDQDLDPITAEASWFINFDDVNGTPVGAQSGSSGTVAIVRAKAIGSLSEGKVLFSLGTGGDGETYDYEDPNNRTRLLDHNRQPMPVSVRNATLDIF